MKLIWILIIFVIGTIFSLKTRKTVMSFFNELLLGTHNTEDAKSEAKKSPGLLNKLDGPQNDPAKNDTITGQNNKTAIPSKSKSTFRIGDWYSIKSMEITDTTLLPTLKNNKGNDMQVEMDMGFRVNPTFKPENAKIPTSPPTMYSFYVIINDKMLYYTSNPKDINILGGIPLGIIVSSVLVPGEQNCVEVMASDNTQWSLCSNCFNKVKNLYCKLQSLNLVGDPRCHQSEFILSENPTVVMKEKIQPIVMIPLRSRNCNEDWNYYTQGKDWECTCKEGSRQSPIDLPLAESTIDNPLTPAQISQAVISSPIVPTFNFEIVSAISPVSSIDGYLKENEHMKIVYKDNAVRLYHHNFGKLTTIDGTVYQAEQISFHLPSEHTINGQRFPMEMQIAFYGVSKGDISKQAIVSFLFTKSPGYYNKFIDDIDFTNLPNPQEKEKIVKNNLYIPKIFYDSESKEDSVFKSFSFYTYDGSLSYPPCTERTIRYVASVPIKIGNMALTMFANALKKEERLDENGNIIEAASPPNISSYRQIQPLNNRPIYYYKAEVRTEAPENKSDGHYEIVPAEVDKIFEVAGSKPSGIEGSIVIPIVEALNIRAIPTK